MAKCKYCDKETDNKELIGTTGLLILTYCCKQCFQDQMLIGDI